LFFSSCSQFEIKIFVCIIKCDSRI
jgi:hypothetical protein